MWTERGKIASKHPNTLALKHALRFHDIIGGIHVPVDDGVDKLNRKYTLLVFLFLALPIFTKQYIGDPIECFAPVYFAEHQSRYINSYCWTQSTYYMVPVGDPDDDGDQVSRGAALAGGAGAGPSPSPSPSGLANICRPPLVRARLFD